MASEPVYPVLWSGLLQSDDALFVVMTCDRGSRESGPGFWPLTVELVCIPGWSDQPVPTCTGSLQERHRYRRTESSSTRACVSVTDLAPSDPVLVRVGPGLTSMGQPPPPPPPPCYTLQSERRQMSARSWLLVTQLRRAAAPGAGRRSSGVVYAARARRTPKATPCAPPPP